MRTWISCSVVCLAVLSLARPLAAQIVQEGTASTDAVPPPPLQETAPAQLEAELASPSQPSQVAPAQPATAAAAPQQTASAYGQPAYGQPVYGQPVYGQPVQPLTPARRRGDRLEDSANAGEVVDLMIMSGGYGVFLANSIVSWADLDVTFDSTGRMVRSSDDVVRIRFLSTFLGATLSLTGLLGSEAPRGVPTTMAMGIRFGLAWSAFGAGAASSGGNAEDLLAVMAIGGVVGLGIGTGLGYGLRPHPSRSRFVETGFIWGTALGAMLGGAFTRVDGRAVLGGMLAGGLGAMTAHTIVAALTPVHLGRGWLMNAAFGAGCGLAALFTWGFGGTSVSGETYLATMAATGFVALAVVFALTDGIQDSGWDDESVPEVVRSLRLDVAPTQDGAIGMLRGQF